MLALIAKHKEVITYLLELDFPVNKISIHVSLITITYEDFYIFI